MKNKSDVSYFQSCSHFDRPFVKPEIIQYLENEHGYTLCVHERDFAVGDTIPANIEVAKNYSRRMIMVLSRYRKLYPLLLNSNLSFKIISGIIM